MGLLSGGLLVLAIAMLAATGMAAAFTLLIGSLAESLLAAYVIAWAWLVASLTALSLVGGVSAPGLWVVLIAGVACSGTAWYVAGRPRLALKPSVVGLGEAIRVGPVAVLAVSVALGVAYTSSPASGSRRTTATRSHTTSRAPFCGNSRSPSGGSRTQPTRD